MSQADINYLRAEMSQAQKSGELKAYVRVAELQSVLHRLAALERDSAFAARPKMAGFIQGDMLKALIQGDIKAAHFRRRKSGSHTTALYFIDIDAPAS